MQGFYVKPHDLPKAAHGGVSLVKDRKVVKVSAEEKKVYLDDGTTVGFEYCLLATGKCIRSGAKGSGPNRESNPGPLAGWCRCSPFASRSGWEGEADCFLLEESIEGTEELCHQ